jgi:glycine/D-amino acid oxidase-like deaminating enzyme/nitrite reductase/ring-hydroxylating ferredoxin subunit
METKSIWEGTSGEQKMYPIFEGQAEADVVVIGGGITGLTAAMLLSEAGKKVILLEALRIGLGTTGNSTGNLYITVDESLHSIKKKWNKDIVKAVLQSRGLAIDLIENTVRHLDIECDFYRTNFNYFTELAKKETAEFIRNEYETLLEAGINATITDSPAIPFNAKKLLSFTNQAQFHPLKYVRGLADKLSSKVSIYENSKVTDFDEDTGVVKTMKGTIKAGEVIMATHTPKGVFMVQTALGPYREHGVAVELKGSFPNGIFWGLDNPKFSVRAFKDEKKNYVMVIGDKYKTGHGHDTFKYINELENFLTNRFDTNGDKFMWAGQHYRSADGLPYIGKQGKRMYIMTGFATDGLVYGTMAAMIVSDMINRKENAWQETYKLRRFTPLKSFKEFLKENTDVLTQYLKDTPWNADAKDLTEINRGEAKLMEKNNEKLAVYKDQNGCVHVISAVCTHLKCIVNWNPAEKTWDCPCHGSRFTINGTVLEGPAVDNLPYKKIEAK